MENYGQFFFFFQKIKLKIQRIRYIYRKIAAASKISDATFLMIFYYIFYFPFLIYGNKFLSNILLENLDKIYVINSFDIFFIIMVLFIVRKFIIIYFWGNSLTWKFLVIIRDLKGYSPFTFLYLGDIFTEIIQYLDAPPVAECQRSKLDDGRCQFQIPVSLIDLAVRRFPWFSPKLA